MSTIPATEQQSHDSALHELVEFLEGKLPPAAFLKASTLLSDVIENEAKHFPREPSELQQELADAESLRERMSDILRRTAVALHGGELENGYWSWHDLPELAAILRDGLQFYASENHFSKGDESDWDTVSGEPANFWCDEHGNTIEDGSIAKMALALQPIVEEPELPLGDPPDDTFVVGPPVDVDEVLRAIDEYKQPETKVEKQP